MLSLGPAQPAPLHPHRARACPRAPVAEVRVSVRVRAHPGEPSSRGKAPGALGTSPSRLPGWGSPWPTWQRAPLGVIPTERLALLPPVISQAELASDPSGLAGSRFVHLQVSQRGSECPWGDYLDQRQGRPSSGCPPTPAVPRPFSLTLESQHGLSAVAQPSRCTEVTVCAS